MTQDTTASSSLSIPQLLLGSSVPNTVAFEAFWLLARVAVGALMIHNGFGKLEDVPGFAENVVSFIGLPFPTFFTYCAAYTEIVASIALIAGLFTRLNAIALLITMGVAIVFHLKADGFIIPPLETASLYATFYAAFLVGGSGAWSLDALIAKQFES